MHVTSKRVSSQVECCKAFHQEVSGLIAGLTAPVWGCRERTMALRSNLWSSETLGRGLALARQQTLSLHADAELLAMKQELEEPGVLGVQCYF